MDVFPLSKRYVFQCHVGIKECITPLWSKKPPFEIEIFEFCWRVTALYRGANPWNLYKITKTTSATNWLLLLILVEVDCSLVRKHSNGNPWNFGLSKRQDSHTMVLHVAYLSNSIFCQSYPGSLPRSFISYNLWALSHPLTTTTPFFVGDLCHALQGCLAVHSYGSLYDDLRGVTTLLSLPEISGFGGEDWPSTWRVIPWLDDILGPPPLKHPNSWPIWMGNVALGDNNDHHGYEPLTVLNGMILQCSWKKTSGGKLEKNDVEVGLSV